MSAPDPGPGAAPHPTSRDPGPATARAWHDGIDLHVLYLHGLLLLPSAVLIGGLAQVPGGGRRVALAAVLCVCAGLPGSVGLARLADGARFQPGERARYALTNLGVLALGTGGLALFAWSRLG